MTASSSDRDVLDLRFRAASVPIDPPDLAAFHRRPSADAASLLPRPEEIGVAGSDPRAALEAVRRSPMLVVFFEHGGFDIPAIAPIPEGGTDGPSGSLPDLDAWSLRPTRFGWLAAVPRERPRTGPMRAAWIVAACLPLALPPAVASASAPPRASATAPAEAPAQPTSTARPPTIPPFPGERTTDLEPPADPPPPAPEPEPAATTCPEPVVAIPEWILEGKREVSVVDAAWEGVIGYDVELELKGGRELEGRVTAVQPDTFTLIHRESGIVRVLQKNAVAQLRVRVPKDVPLPAEDGVGMLAGGGLLTAIGTPVFLSGAVFLGVCPSCVGLHVTLLITGGAALGGGIPLLVGGSRRRRAYNEARDARMTIAPAGGATRHGWTGGVRLRF